MHAELSRHDGRNRPGRPGAVQWLEAKYLGRMLVRPEAKSGRSVSWRMQNSEIAFGFAAPVTGEQNKGKACVFRGERVAVVRGSRNRQAALQWLRHRQVCQ